MKLSVLTRQKRAYRGRSRRLGPNACVPTGGYVHLPAQNLAFLRPRSARRPPVRRLLREAGPQRPPPGRLSTGAFAAAKKNSKDSKVNSNYKLPSLGAMHGELFQAGSFGY